MLRTDFARLNIGSLVLGAVIAVLLCQSGSAFAQEADQPLSVLVRTHGIDLQSAEGSRVLDRRIARAARKVCLATRGRITPAAAQCVSEARHNAHRISRAAATQMER